MLALHDARPTLYLGGAGGFTLVAVTAFNMDAVSVLYKNTGILDKVVFISERLHDEATCFGIAGEALFSVGGFFFWSPVRFLVPRLTSEMEYLTALWHPPP